MRLFQFGAFLDAALHQLADFFELWPRVNRADVGILVERIAHTQGLDPIAQFGNHSSINSLLHEKPRTGAAHVALVEIDSSNDAFDGLVDRGILENDIGRFAAKLEGKFWSAELPLFVVRFCIDPLQLHTGLGQRPRNQLSHFR